MGKEVWRRSTYSLLVTVGPERREIHGGELAAFPGLLFQRVRSYQQARGGSGPLALEL